MITSKRLQTISLTVLIRFLITVDIIRNILVIYLLPFGHQQILLQLLFLLLEIFEVLLHISFNCFNLELVGISCELCWLISQRLDCDLLLAFV